MNNLDGEYTIEGKAEGECFIIFRAAGGDEVAIHCIYCGYYKPDEKITPFN